VTLSGSDLAELNRQIGVLIALTAAQVGPAMSLAERAPLLHRLGLDRVEIARVCGATPEVVSVRLAEAKRKRGRSAALGRRTHGDRSDG
jgi:hypothetical protein